MLPLLTNLALAEFKCGNKAAARKHLSEALDIGLQFVRVSGQAKLFAVAGEILMEDDLKASRSYLSTAAQLFAKTPAWRDELTKNHWMLARLQMKLHDYAGANELFKKSLADWPGLRAMDEDYRQMLEEYESSLRKVDNLQDLPAVKLALQALNASPGKLTDKLRSGIRRP